MAARTRSGPSGVFIAIVACLFGVVVTSIVSPIADDGGRGLTTGGAAQSELDGSQSGLGDGTGAGADPASGTPEVAVDAGGADAGPTVDGGAQAGSASGPAASTDAGGAPTAGGGPSAPAPAGPGAAPTAGPAPSGPVRGVTADTIKIGFAVAESGPIETVARIGDTEGHLRSVLDGWEKAGLVPVHGRKIVPVVRKFDLINAAEQRAACVGFAQDDEVFMVLAPLVFVAGAECLAREFKVPVIASAGAVPGDDWFARTRPYGFYTNMSDTRVGVNFIHWADDQGLLDGKRIGLNYPDDQITRERVKAAVKQTLADLGHKVVLDFPSPEESEGLAVQRFIAERIDMAIVMGGNQTGPRAADFSQAAQVQGYEPTYILSEFLQTGALAPGFADGFHPEQFDGALAMTYYRRAEDGRFGNPPIPEPGLQCERQYESFSGRKIDRFEDSNEWDALQHACDQGRATMTALQSVGRNLTALGFTGALEKVQGQESGEMATIGFSPTKHDGANAIKSMRWKRGCSCWTHASNFRSLYVSG